MLMQQLGLTPPAPNHRRFFDIQAPAAAGDLGFTGRKPELWEPFEVVFELRPASLFAVLSESGRGPCGSARRIMDSPIGRRPPSQR
jgi:hypothetical protein